MSLAFNLFFWDDWTGTTGSGGTTTDPGGGGGKHKKKPRLDYPADTDFWDWRERFIRSSLPEPEPQPPLEPDDSLRFQLTRLNEERSNLIIAMRSSSSIATMQAQVKRLAELNAEIKALLGSLTVHRFRQ